MKTNNKRYFIFIGLMIAAIYVNAKIISGKVTDETASPLEFVTIAACNDSTVFASSLTDSTGYFSLELSPAATKIRLTLFGYKPLTLPIDSLSSNPLVLHSTATDLKEVVVNGEPVTFEADRFVLNLNADPSAKGKDISQVLQSAPGVWLDRKRLSIFGKTGTQVYINDRRVKMNGERLFSYLQSLPSASVASIEIIPEAGAEYSASFIGGIIRIKLKKVITDGYNGNASLSLTGKKESFSFTPALNFAYHKNKFTLDAIASFYTNPYSRSNGSEYSENYSSESEIRTSTASRNHSFSPNALISATFDFNKSNSLGIEAEYSPNVNHSRNTSISFLSSAGKYDGKTSGDYSSRDISHNFDSRLNFSHTFDKMGSFIKLLGGFSRRNSSTDENNSSHTLDLDSIYDVELDAAVTTVNGEIRLQKNFSKVWRLSAGFKHTYNNVSNRAIHSYMSEGVPTPDYNFDYDASYKENISAIYLSVPGKIGIVSVRAGLRGELFKTSGAGLDRTETGLFPTASLSLPLLHSGKLNLSATYSRKVKRPTFWQLSPLVRQFSNYYYTVGNMHLKSAITNSLSLRLMIAKKFTIGANYSSVANPIRQMFATDPAFPGRLYLTYGNNGYEHNVNAYFTGRISPVKSWILGGTFTFISQFQRMNDSEPFDSYYSFCGQLSSFHSLPAGFSLTLTAMYYTPSQIGNIRISTFSDVSVSLNKKLGKGWDLSLSGSNIIPLKNTTTTKSNGMYLRSSGHTRASASLRISYAFSSGKSFKKKKVENVLDSSRLSND